MILKLFAEQLCRASRLKAKRREAAEKERLAKERLLDREIEEPRLSEKRSAEERLKVLALLERAPSWDISWIRVRRTFIDVEEETRVSQK